MGVVNIRSVGSREAQSAIDTIVLAFSTDPVARWCWSEPHQYLASMPSFVRAFAGASFDHDTAFSTADHAGAALWLPPDVHSDDDALAELVERTVAEEVRTDLYGMLAQMGAYHPDEPHWYLPMIGVDTPQQGKGYGSALLKKSLERVDTDNLKAYLESTNPKNVPLYQRYGFEVLGTIQVGSSPPLFPMLREPR